MWCLLFTRGCITSLVFVVVLSQPQDTFSVNWPRLKLCFFEDKQLIVARAKVLMLRLETLKS